MPTGTPPSADALFYDTFDGSAGPVAGHVPDYNVAGDAAWTPGATQQSGTSWVDRPYDPVTTFPGVLTGSGGVTGDDTFYNATPRMLYPGYASDPEVPYEQPAEITRDSFKVTFDITFDIASTVEDSDTNGLFGLYVGRRGVYSDQGNIASPLVFDDYARIGSNYSAPLGGWWLSLASQSATQVLGFTFEAGVLYTCTLSVTPDEITFVGIGVTRTVTPLLGPLNAGLTNAMKSAFGPVTLSVTRHSVISRVLVETLTAPTPGVAFWSNFVGAYEVVGESGPPDGGAGTSPETAFEVAAPYTETLGAMNGTPIWYVVTLGAGSWKFSTADSPSGEAYDTYLALFDESGVVVAQNEDINEGADDYRSQIVETLTAGTYYLAMSTYEGNAANGFLVTAGITNVIAGTVLKIEAA